jgi:hypothetical protein
MRVEPGFCDKIIKHDRSIRFVGLVNNRGEVIEGGFKHGVEPLLNGTDEQQMYIHSLSNLSILQSYSDRLGIVRYSLTEHEKVTLMTFPIDEKILCVSTTPKGDTSKIRDKVLKVLKSKQRGKALDKVRKSTTTSTKQRRENLKKGQYNKKKSTK